MSNHSGPLPTTSAVKAVAKSKSCCIEVSRDFISEVRVRKSACVRGSAENESETCPGPTASCGSDKDFSLYCLIGNKPREGTVIVFSLLSLQ